MRYLLDTMVWLWSVGPTEKIGKQGLEILRKGEEEIYFSAASAFEIAIKAKIGKFQVPEEPAHYVPRRLTEQGIRSLPITHTHALKVYDLPRFHNDPFDWLIIAQAMVEDLVVLTSDRLFEKYPVDIIWCGR
jgi:PIN domain nuclease of toxin-antitoxin system